MIHRRHFIKNTSGALALISLGQAIKIKNPRLLLSFSTLGCPEWSFEQIVNFASTNGYDGLEFRGIQKELDLTKCEVFKPGKINTTKEILRAKNLKVVNLGSSCALHFPLGAERTKNIDEGKRFIELAANLNCKFIRVFPNSLPKGQDKRVTLDLITEGLNQLGSFANGTGVKVLMESHGDLVNTDDIIYVISKAQPNVGLVWDVVNMWSVNKQPPAEVFNSLKKYIFHTHIKDLKVINNKEEYTLLGDGQAPIFRAIDVMIRGGYAGFYSFEWEKLWHPELASPEIALADYPVKMKRHFNFK